ncbi:MAG: sigma-54 dependent transcriptional regulator [Bryobacteraceae bacterium]|jgi:DNA-binding NtrC family response regulator
MEAQRVLWIAATSRWAADMPPRPGAWHVESLSVGAALQQLRCVAYDAVVLDLPIPDWTPDEILEQARRSAPGIPVLIRDPQATLADAVRLARLGAEQFLALGEPPWPLIHQAIGKRRSQALLGLAQPGAGESWRRFLIGDSQPMRDVCHIIRMVGGRRATVLITGETGAGKEMAARALHMAGPRSRGQFVAVNCSALPENLMEDELFGHVRGAFTGATQNRVGRFEQAHGGVLFLDEIGELPHELQAKLLRVLQEREFQRLGSSETVRVDVRVIAAANCALAERIAQRRFREDLYYRLNVVPIHMPPLRDRREDIPALAAHFVEKVCRAEEVAPKRLAAEAAERLCRRPWPGNVRQLENAVEMAVALSGDRPVLAEPDFPMTPGEPPGLAILPAAPCVSVPDSGLDFERILAGIERSILDQALRMTGGNKKAAADMLRLKRTTLSAKIRSLESVAACA